MDAALRRGATESDVRCGVRDVSPVVERGRQKEGTRGGRPAASAMPPACFGCMSWVALPFCRLSERDRDRETETERQRERERDGKGKNHQHESITQALKRPTKRDTGTPTETDTGRHRETQQRSIRRRLELTQRPRVVCEQCARHAVRRDARSAACSVDVTRSGSGAAANLQHGEGGDGDGHHILEALSSSL